MLDSKLECFNLYLQFLNRVADIQEQQAREEQLRQEAELAKQRKVQGSRQTTTLST